MAVGLAACASAPERPLQPAADAMLAQPDLAGLARDASTLKHPRLTPVEIDPAKPLTPEEIGLIAVVASPDLKAARAKAGVAEAQVFDAGLLPDPTLTLGADKLLSGPDMFNAWLVQIVQDLAALRDRPTALEQARQAARQVRLDIAWQEWQTAGQARLLAVRIAALERIAAIDAATKANADDMLQRVLAAAARGDVKADDVEARRIAAADAADKAAQAAKDLDAARQDLDKLLGLRPDTQVAIAEVQPMPSPVDAEGLFRRARAQRLDLVALEAGYASQKAAVRKAILDAFPTLQLTVSRAQDTSNNQTLGGQVSFTLPVWNANRGGIRIAEATQDQLRAEYAARVFTTRGDIAELVSGLRLEERERAEVQAQLGPLATLAAATEAAARRGDVSLATATTARQSVNDKALLAATLDQAIGEQQVALAIAVGGPLDQSRTD
jgi:outer membrane protein TolC